MVRTGPAAPSPGVCACARSTSPASAVNIAEKTARATGGRRRSCSVSTLRTPSRRCARPAAGLASLYARACSSVSRKPPSMV